MNKFAKLVLSVGSIIIAITLIIFFVPNFGDAKTELQYAKLISVLVSEIVVILGYLYLSKGRTVFVNAGLSSMLLVYFVINLVLSLLVSKIELLITFSSIVLLIVLAIALFITRADSHLIAESEEKKDLDKPKSGSSF